MSVQDITFSVNDYDEDGHLMDRGVYFHLGDTRIKMCGTIEEFTDIVSQVNKIQEELEDGYYD